MEPAADGLFDELKQLIISYSYRAGRLVRLLLLYS